MSKVCIGVVYKNSAQWLPQVLKNIELYAKCFANYEVVLVDGHSTDFSTVMCLEWAVKDSQNRRVMVQPSKNLPRPAMLLEARTMVINAFLPSFGPGVFLLLLDSDSVNAPPLNIRGFMTCFKNNKWDALFANQPKCYYDVWTLRDENLPHDYQAEWRQTGGDLAAITAKYQVPKPPSLGFWPVLSAYGGAALYKTEKMTPDPPKYQCYSPDGHEVCELVPFNLEMGQRGAKMFINCEWLNGDHE